MKLLPEFLKGIIKQNPIFVLALGLCPVLAVSTSVKNALGMGAAATFVLVGSNCIVSLIKKAVPDKIRIPCFIIVIATFVTIAELVMKAYSPALNRALGIYVSLIVVNCVVLGRAEAFASHRTLPASLVDALGMGVGFTLGLALISAVRELLGSGQLLGYTILPGFQPALMMALPPGALLVIGGMLGFFNLLKGRRE